jgi:hypothetical protein
LYVLITPVLAVIAFIRRDLLLEALLLTGATFPFFQWLISLEGQSSGFLRYYFYVALYAMLQLGYALQPRLTPFLRRVQTHWLALTVGLIMAAGNYATWVGLEDPGVVVVGEADYLRAVATGSFEGAGPWGERRRDKPDMARYLHEVVFKQYPDARVLVDEQRANDLVLFTGELDRFVTTRSEHFTEYLRNPVGNITHMLVPQIVTSGTDLLLETYPLLYEQGAEFATLEHELGTQRSGFWRLYKVRPPDPNQGPARR